MSVTRMRSAGFALERSAIIVTGSTITTLPPCSICTLAWPSAVMVMAPPGASTVVVVGSWAYPTPAANTTNEATLHRSFIKVLLSPFRRDAAGLYSAAPTARSTRADRVSGPPRQHWLVASQSDATGGLRMTVGARRMFAGGTAVSLACLVMTASLRAQTAAERVPVVEETFKTVQLLR